MNLFTRRVLFLLFFLSGFSGLVYQVVWTRLAFASFGIITPVLSVVISVFMLGLALGAWLGGRWIGRWTARSGWSAVIFYGAAELVIGLGAFVVPKLFAVGDNLLLASGASDSFGYLSLSALVLAVSILPWCVCMGTTFPFMMAYIREQERNQASGFSFLYLANVLGAMCGTALSAVVYIELFGFNHTLWLAAAGNFVIAFISFCLGRAPLQPDQTPAASTGAFFAAPIIGPQDRTIKWILFFTGFIAMAMEVVWTRAFTPVLKTQVYSFAMILFTYLGATFLGSWMYRRALKLNQVTTKSILMAGLAVLAFFPIVVNNPKVLVAEYWNPFLNWWSVLILLAGIVPFCALLGYLTPGLIDEYAGGNPSRAGRAYAINVLGCILGPLFACYFLLPRMSERYALILLALPFLFFCVLFRREYPRRLALALAALLCVVLGWAALGAKDFEGLIKEKYGDEMVTRRDYVATVLCFGDGANRKLLVNGIGMTKLTPITKMMAHLPLAYHHTPPQSALVICFGMGTSFRAAMSWNVDTTAVELVPGVTKVFGYFYADAARLATAANAHIITDDGRRFLRRTPEKFDVIIVDPPPPVQAAGSSLLFSREFFALARQHLNPGGILQMWYPGDADLDTSQAVLRSMCDSFPYVRCFTSIEGWGLHMLGSMSPMDKVGADELVARMPASAQHDLLEWYDATNAASILGQVLTNEFNPRDYLNQDESVQITDDHPMNEYYFLRDLIHSPTLTTNTAAQ